MFKFIKTLFLAMMATTSMFAADRFPSQSVFLGVAAGDKLMQLDAAWAVGHEGYSMYGLHAGSFGNSTSPKPYDYTKISGSQVGFMYDQGRSMWVLGWENANVSGNHGGDTSKYTRNGIYGKFGYKIRDIIVYGSYGPTTKAMVGVGWSHNFNF